MALWLQPMGQLSLNLHHLLQLLADFPVMIQGSPVLQIEVRGFLIEHWPFFLLITGQ